MSRRWSMAGKERVVEALGRQSEALRGLGFSAGGSEEVGGGVRVVVIGYVLGTDAGDGQLQHSSAVKSAGLASECPLTCTTGGG